MKPTKVAALIAIACSLMLLFTGCGKQAEKVLIVAQGVDATTLDPGMHAETTTGNVERQIFDTLIMLDGEMQFQPLIATSWQAVDETTWKVAIRNDVTWHDGSQLTATDVKYSIDRIKDLAKQSPQASNFSAVSEVKVDGDYALTIQTKQPYPVLPARLANLRIVPKQYIERVGDTAFSQQPIGSGPYKFVSWVKDESITLQANEQYWQGAAAIKKVVFKAIPEASSRVMALQAGQIDIAVNIPPDQVSTVDGSKNAKTAKVASSRNIFVPIMGEDGPLANPLVRQALNHAVNVPAIIDGPLGGNGIAMTQNLNPMDFGYDDSLQAYGYDPEKAKSLLAEAGYADGFEVRFTTPSGRYMMDKEVAEAIKGQLEAVGIRVDLKVLEWGTYVNQIISHTLDTDLWLIGWGTSLFDADGTLYSWFHTGQTFYYYPADAAKAQEMDQWLDHARTTMDTQDRLATYSQALEKLHAEAPWILLYQQMDIYGVSNRVEWQPRSDESIQIYTANWK